MIPDEKADKSLKKFRVMGEYGSTGIWGENGMVENPQDVGLSLQLCTRLERWHHNWETLHRNVPDDLAVDLGKRNAVGQQGFDLACDIKRENRHWMVYYHDDRRDCWKVNAQSNGEAVPPLKLRPWFEYEITSEVMGTGDGPMLEAILAQLGIENEEFER